MKTQKILSILLAVALVITAVTVPTTPVFAANQVTLDKYYSDTIHVDNLGEYYEEMAKRVLALTPEVLVNFKLTPDNREQVLIAYKDTQKLAEMVYAYDSPQSGDYMKLMVSSMSLVKGSESITEGDYGELTLAERAQGKAIEQISFKIKILYRTTYNIEQGVKNQLENIEKVLNLENDTDIDKLLKIHNYVIYNMKPGSGRNIINATADHFGYSLLTCRLIKEFTDMDARIVYGTSLNKSRAWNVVKINDKWYHLDTYGDDLEKADKMKFFLRGSDTGFFTMVTRGTGTPSTEVRENIAKEDYGYTLGTLNYGAYGKSVAIKLGAVKSRSMTILSDAKRAADVATWTSAKPELVYVNATGRLTVKDAEAFAASSTPVVVTATYTTRGLGEERPYVETYMVYPTLNYISRAKFKNLAIPKTALNNGAEYTFDPTTQVEALTKDGKVADETIFASTGNTMVMPFVQKANGQTVVKVQGPGKVAFAALAGTIRLSQTVDIKNIPVSVRILDTSGDGRRYISKTSTLMLPRPVIYPAGSIADFQFSVQNPVESGMSVTQQGSTWKINASKTAEKPGIINISLKSYPNVNNSITYVPVSGVTKPKFTLANTSIRQGFASKATLSGVVQGDMKWGTDNFDIVYIDKDGNIFGKKPGKANIYVVVNGSKSVLQQIEVKRASTVTRAPSIGFYNVTTTLGAINKALYTENSNGSISGFNKSVGTPAALVITGEADYKVGVNIAPAEGTDDLNKIQIITIEPYEDGFVDVVTAGWGTTDGIPMDEYKLSVFVIGNTPGTYKFKLQLLNREESNKVVAESTEYIIKIEE